MLNQEVSVGRRRSAGLRTAVRTQALHKFSSFFVVTGVRIAGRRAQGLQRRQNPDHPDDCTGRSA